MSDIEVRVKKIIAEQLGVEESQVTNEKAFVAALGADSLDTVELVMALEDEFGIEIPDEETHWKEAMRRRAVSARQVLADHSWAIGLLETRGSMGHATMRYLDAILGNLRSAGISLENAVHAFWLLDSYVYGHVIQETSLSPVSTSPPGTQSTAGLLEQATMAEYPHLVEVAEHALGSEYSVDREFQYGLDLILDALEQAATPAAG